MGRTVLRRTTLSAAAAALALGTVVLPASGDGSVDLTEAGLLPELQGVCADFVSGATGMVESGSGTVADLVVPGEPLLTFLEWSGTDHVPGNDPSGDDPDTSTLQVAVDGGAAQPVEGTKLPEPAGTAIAPPGPSDPDNPHEVYAWLADISDLVTAAGTYDFDLAGWLAEDWFAEGAGSWGATVTVVYELPGPCTEPSDISWRGGVDVYFGGGNENQEAVWGSGDPANPAPGEGHVTDLFVFEVPASTEDRVVTVQFTAGGVAQAAVGVCREANLWYAAGEGAAPPPTDDLVTFDTWGEPIAPAGLSGIEIARQPFGYPGCDPVINPTDRLAAGSNPGRTDGLGDSWVVPEDGHACPDPTTCAYQAVEIRPVDGGFVGRDWALSQVDVIVPAGSTWLAFQLESPTDALARTGDLEESGGWAGQVLLKIPSVLQVGALEVVKTLSGATQGYVDGTTFGVTVDCDNDAFDAELDLVPDEPQLIEDIPLGTECTVEETGVPDAADGFFYGPPTYDPGQTVVIEDADETVTVTVDNPLEDTPLGGLAIGKVVTGEVDGYVDGSEFAFTLDCTDDTLDGEFTLVADEVLVIEGIPLGTECTVDETGVPDAAEGFSYGEPVFDPGPTVTIEEADVVVEIVVENPLESDEPLPKTGGDFGSLLGVGIGLALAGTTMIVVRSRRPSEP
ncbi:MAG: DUF5979 domain-containing protein [Jiangellaceae bacterium]